MQNMPFFINLIAYNGGLLFAEVILLVTYQQWKQFNAFSAEKVNARKHCEEF